jgi:cytidylate kinase
MGNPKKLVIIFGPQAVGKMTVGRALADQTGLRLFYNHMAIEPVLAFFPFGTPSYQRLVSGFRRAIFEEVAESELPGLIFTYVWELTYESDKNFIDEMTAIFRARGAEIYYVELAADLETRLARNRTPERIKAKPSKENLDESEQRIRDWFEKYQLNSNDDFYYPENHIKINNANLSPQEVARLIIDRFQLEENTP